MNRDWKFEWPPPTNFSTCSTQFHISEMGIKVPRFRQVGGSHYWPASTCLQTLSRQFADSLNPEAALNIMCLHPGQCCLEISISFREAWKECHDLHFIAQILEPTALVTFPPCYLEEKRHWPPSFGRLLVRGWGLLSFQYAFCGGREQWSLPNKGSSAKKSWLTVIICHFKTNFLNKLWNHFRFTKMLQR